VQCPSCGTRNSSHHHYCYFCGFTLPTQQKQDLSDESDNNLPLLSNQLIDEEQTPLKRYNKSQSRKFSVNYLRFIPSLLVLALLIFGSISLFRFLNTVFITNDVSAEQITATARVESTIFEGNPAQKIIVHTNIGEVVEALDRRFPVREGIAEIIFENAFLHSRFPAAERQNGIEITLDITVYKEGVASYKETMNFIMEMPFAPLTLIQPSLGEAIVEEATYRLIFTVSEGSAVFINGDEFTDLLDETGRLQKDLTVPDVAESTYEIRVVKRGFKDNIVNVVLNREVQIVPFSLEHDLPIKAERDTVIISGTTHPGAAISTDLELIGDPNVNFETGAFSIEVRSDRPGLSAGKLTATLTDGQISQLDVVIFRTMTEADYTRRAWELDFAELAANPSLHNGQIFLFRGTIAEVLFFGDRNIFTVNISEDQSNPQLILVEFWGEFEFEPGETIRVFGNRWGNRDGMIRILAPFIYP